MRKLSVKNDLYLVIRPNIIRRKELAADKTRNKIN